MKDSFITGAIIVTVIHFVDMEQMVGDPNLQKLGNNPIGAIVRDSILQMNQWHNNWPPLWLFRLSCRPP